MIQKQKKLQTKNLQTLENTCCNACHVIAQLRMSKRKEFLQQCWMYKVNRVDHHHGWISFFIINNDNSNKNSARNEILQLHGSIQFIAITNYDKYLSYC